MVRRKVIGTEKLYSASKLNINLTEIIIFDFRLPIEDGNQTSPDQTILSVASSLPPSMDYDIDTLRAELTKLGFKPGPILESTKTLYLKKLHALKKNPIVAKQNEQGKSKFVEKLLSRPKFRHK